MFARASMTAMIEDARQIADLIARLENQARRRITDAAVRLSTHTTLGARWPRVSRR
jgi:hypothetical protein